MSQWRQGTVLVTNGSAAVVGTGTSWLSAGFVGGELFTVLGSAVPYVVAGAPSDDTHLTLSSNYGGTTLGGQNYAVTTGFTPNRQLPYMEFGDVDTPTIFKRLALLLDTLLGAVLAASKLVTTNANGNLTTGGNVTHSGNLGINGAGVLTLTNPGGVPAGSLAAVSLFNGADVDTGPYYPAAGEYGIVVDGVEVFRARAVGSSHFRKNLLMNGDFRIDQRNGGAIRTVNDDAYGLDRFYALSQITGDAQWSRQTVQENGQPFNLRITHNNATARRQGAASIIEGRDCKHLRGQFVTLSGRVRRSVASLYRFFILEWAGTEDAPTSDVVNTWTSTTFTNGNFFIADANLIPSANGSKTPGGTGWESFSLTAQLGSTFNNLVVLVTSGGTMANADTMDIGKLQLESGKVPTEFDLRPLALEIELVQRYYEKSFNLDTAPAQNLGANTGESDFMAGVAGATAQFGGISYKVPKRAAATTLTTFNPAAATAQVRDKTAAANLTAVATANSGENGFRVTATGAAGTAVGNNLGVHWTAEAEL